MRIASFIAAGALALAALPETADAALVEFQSFTGNVALSTDGFGSTTDIGTISASVPEGSTVVAAYLYTATNWGTPTPTDLTLGGTTVTYDTTVPNDTACCSLASHRADVTAIVSAVIDGGAGGVYDFAVNEGTLGYGIDGSALVVVYSNPTLPTASVGILDGFASVDGDTTAINFAEPLDTTNPDFFAEMVLGIGFSCCGQSSTVEVNGTLITANAGNNDDGTVVADGSLITVGSFDDPFSALLPGYEEDHERYDLAAYVTNGDTSIQIATANASGDDNIFLAAFYVSGEAGFNEPPPATVPLPASALLFGSAFAGLFGLRRFRKAA